MAALLADVQRNVPNDVGAMLSEIIDSATRALPGAQYAGVTVASRGGEVRSIAATNPIAAALDEIQERERQGPCLEAAWEDHVVRVDDLTTESRWPRYSRSALRESPVRSIVSFRLFVDQSTLGALNFYAEEPGAFDDDAVELGFVFATHAALAWGMMRRDEQFRSALASRDIIGQAKGMLMERFAVDAVRAFDLLKKLSQDTNTPVTRIAEQIVEKGTAQHER
ncbi:GAF and ANTAR domain-containing protein [Mycolicibacterium sediminis]|nr:GAF and ANTAR domain-containing protein [Mycolicibacterium sediminis]